MCLLDLPAEIRNHIYKDTLVESDPIRLKTGPPFIQEPSLLFTCTQVRTESIAIFYGANCYESAATESLERFIRLFTRAKLQMLRSLCIIAPTDIIKISVEMTTPALIIQHLLQPDGKSLKLYVGELVMEEQRKIAVKLVSDGEKNGIQREAMLLPVFSLANEDPLFVSFDEYGQYTLEQKNGKVCHVKLSIS